jgi:large subunit ribosomal protein L30
MAEKQVKVTLVRSTIGTKQDHRDTVRGLGLRRVNSSKVLKVTLVRSTSGCKKDHRETVRGLGLRRINSTKVLKDTPEVRGMINKVDYLVTATEV